MDIEIGLCQYELRDGEHVDELLDRAEALLARAGPADVYVLPELFATDVTGVVESEVNATILGNEQVAALHEFVSQAAREHDAVVVGGSYNVHEDGDVYNRCPVATPDGELLTYDKRHLTPEERDIGKRPGERAPPIVEHPGVNVGVLVCYDVEFPEAVRELVNRGAEVIAVPSWTGDEAGFERVRRCAAARAVENQAYVAQVPLVGQVSDDVGGVGRSAVFAPCDGVVGPHGTLLSLPRDVHAAGRCSVDVDALRKSRESAEVRPYTDAQDVY